MLPSNIEGSWLKREFGLSQQQCQGGTVHLFQRLPPQTQINSEAVFLLGTKTIFTVVFNSVFLDLKLRLHGCAIFRNKRKKVYLQFSVPSWIKKTEARENILLSFEREFGRKKIRKKKSWILFSLINLLAWAFFVIKYLYGPCLRLECLKSIGTGQRFSESQRTWEDKNDSKDIN